MGSGEGQLLDGVERTSDPLDYSEPLHSTLGKQHTKTGPLLRLSGPLLLASGLRGNFRRATNKFEERIGQSTRWPTKDKSDEDDTTECDAKAADEAQSYTSKRP